MTNELRATIQRELNRLADNVVDRAAQIDLSDYDTFTVTTEIDGDVIIPDDLRAWYEADIVSRLNEQHGVTRERIMFSYGPNHERVRERQQEEAKKRARGLLVRSIGEKAVKAMENGHPHAVKSRMDKRVTYLVKWGNVTMKARFDVLGVKTRPLDWSLCIGPTDGALDAYDKAYTLITMLQANELEFVREANFRTVSTQDEAADRNRARGDGGAFVDAIRRFRDETDRTTRPTRGERIVNYAIGAMIFIAVVNVIVNLVF